MLKVILNRLWIAEYLFSIMKIKCCVQFLCSKEISYWHEKRIKFICLIIYFFVLFSCEVLGRQLVRVKICACPKRDKERSERDHYESGGSDPNLKGRRHLVNKKGNKDCKRSPAIRTTLSDYLTKTKKVKLTPLVQVSSDTDNVSVIFIFQVVYLFTRKYLNCSC